MMRGVLSRGMLTTTVQTEQKKKEQSPPAQVKKVPIGFQIRDGEQTT